MVVLREIRGNVFIRKLNFGSDTSSNRCFIGGINSSNLPVSSSSHINLERRDMIPSNSANAQLDSAEWTMPRLRDDKDSNANQLLKEGISFLEQAVQALDSIVGVPHETPLVSNIEVLLDRAFTRLQRVLEKREAVQMDQLCYGDANYNLACVHALCAELIMVSSPSGTGNDECIAQFEAAEELLDFENIDFSLRERIYHDRRMRSLRAGSRLCIEACAKVDSFPKVSSYKLI